MLPAWETEMLAGDDTAAERMARQGCEQLDRLGEHSYMSTLACELAASLYELGRYAEAEHWALRGLELGGADDVSTQVCGLCVRSKLLARTGDLGAALALANQADSAARASDAQIEQGDAALNLAGILRLSGNQAAAEAAARRAIRCYRRKGATAYLTRAQRLLSGWTVGSPAAPG
jgi:tetratricopeptide (TPR) repeat protein